MTRKKPERFSYTQYEMMVLSAIQFLKGKAYGAMMHRVFTKLNEHRREVPSPYQLLRSLHERGLISRSYGIVRVKDQGGNVLKTQKVRFAKVTRAGGHHLALLLRDLDAVEKWGGKKLG